MRPLELTLEGFKSYRKAQTFNFESRTLFGIVGPTGSGKSSILEGLIFGLYGKTPRVESGTKKLINSQEEQARVQLAFESDDIAWEVIRVIRQKGTSQTVLRRLDGHGEPVTGDRAVTARIEEIVGLDFESFRSSVVLPQGEFDRFLKATPTDRSRILKGIFRLERVDLLREGARARWQVLEGQITVHRGTLESFPDQPEVLLASLNREAALARQLLEEVREELPSVLEAEQDIRRSAEDIAAVRRELAETEAALRRLPPEEELRNLADRHDLAASRLDRAREAVEAAIRRLEGADGALAEAVERTGGDAWVAEVEAGLAARDRLVQAASSAKANVEVLADDLAAAAGELPVRRQAFEAAEQAAEAARAALQKLHQRHAASLLRRSLSKGEPCPVCEQQVSSIPGIPELPGLNAAGAAVSQTEGRLGEARSALDAATTKHVLAGERLRLAQEAAQRVDHELDELRRRLSAMAPGAIDLAAEALRRRSELQTARAAAAAARAERDRADGEERRARRDLDSLQERWREVTNLLSHTCGLLGIGSVDVETEGLWDAAKRVMETGLATVEDLGSRIDVLEEAAQSAAGTVGRFRMRFGATVDDDASDVLARVKSDVTRLELKMDEVKVGIERRRQVEAELTTLVERRKRFERLIADFADSKFTAFLLDEQRRLLSRIGSEKFHELTGHYRFDDEGQFQVVDQRTGLTRSPDTLSGGETFLASLSLALALSEAVALEGGRLGCFFLDEGFGYLDQESLDLALEGIESLADPGRMIGLISHVPGVQARLDDLIMLERLPDGSTEVAQHEGPLGYASLLV
ncbi:MAG TPA: SMC family ATPase [Actinomycetota bacterium]|nr:SMC family ATPase [Actinomycetota bacterium]